MQGEPVADDVGVHLHPDDLRQVTAGVLAGVRVELSALFEATARGPAPPGPTRPPVDLDAFDARQFGSLKEDILREIGGTIRQATANFLPEEDIEERITAVSKTIDGRLDSFRATFLADVQKIMADECTKLRTDIFKIFDDLDMPLEEGEKRKATRKKLEGLWAMQQVASEWKRTFFSDLIKSSAGWVAAALVAGLTYMGLKGGGGH